MGIEDFKGYTAKADEYATLAKSSYGSMRGSERGPMAAALAGMYANLAALEVALMADDRRHAKEQAFDKRIKVLERKTGVAERPMPDPFDESATAGV